MKTFVALLIACGVIVAAQARPLQIEEKARIEKPNSSLEFFAGQLGLDGDDALITTSQFFDNRMMPIVKPIAVAATMLTADTRSVLRNPTTSARPYDELLLYGISD